MSVLLTVNSLSISFGGLKAVDDVNFEINKSELLGLIGPNGAGKTTVFNIISGFYSADAGSIKFENQEISQAHQSKGLPCPSSYRAFLRVVCQSSLLS